MKDFDKVNFGIWPTPLYKLENMSKVLGTNIWIKRDDMCGVALGGNKVRKLEYLLADAKKQGYELVITTGAAQSNHAMLTAACALKLGMEPVLALRKSGVMECKGNLILNKLMGAEVRFCDGGCDHIFDVEMDRIGEEKGKKPYKIPVGGSNALGSLGYVNCAKEISEAGVHFDYIVCTCGSGGTAAGTIYGTKLFMPDTHVIAAMVDSDPFDVIVPELMAELKELLEEDTEIPEADLLDMTGPGYSIPSKEGNEAISMMIKNEGIVLDTCYTGKAFAGLIKRAREGYFKPTDNVLFIHTGGAGGLFSQDWENMEL